MEPPQQQNHPTGGFLEGSFPHSLLSTSKQWSPALLNIRCWSVCKGREKSREFEIGLVFVSFLSSIYRGVSSLEVTILLLSPERDESLGSGKNVIHSPSALAELQHGAGSVGSLRRHDDVLAGAAAKTRV